MTSARVYLLVLVLLVLMTSIAAAQGTGCSDVPSCPNVEGMVRVPIGNRDQVATVGPVGLSLKHHAPGSPPCDITAFLTANQPEGLICRPVLCVSLLSDHVYGPYILPADRATNYQYRSTLANQYNMCDLAAWVDCEADPSYVAPIVPDDGTYIPEASTLVLLTLGCTLAILVARRKMRHA